MEGRMILYRGSLKSCNYHCSYCPFSKRPVSERELAKDREQWFSFIRMLERKKAWGIRAMMTVPYGEALIHPWYWQGLARITAWPEMDGAGAQTNLSFPGEMLTDCFVKEGGRIEKLRLWATFHPEMTSVREFAGRCRKMHEMGVKICAGAVGVPENLDTLKRLRGELPEEVYLWINRMDGLRRPYTREEEDAFLELDPCFIRELIPVAADRDRCADRLFAEGDGRMRTCNISPVLARRWDRGEVSGGSEAEPSQEDDFPAPGCGRKYCSCYLAYGGRNDLVSRMLFGPYPLFRIPRRPKAVFLDIEGTLIPGGKGRESGAVSEEFAAALHILAKEGTALFFATTLPCREAMKRCGIIRHFFRGGIFAGGAHLLLGNRSGEDVEQEHFFFLDRFYETAGERLKGMEPGLAFRMLCYRSRRRCYKITLRRSFRRPWKEQEAEELFRSLPPVCRETARYILEENCLQFVSAEADKAGGVRTLCRWMGISETEAFAWGDSEEDREMIKLCGGPDVSERKQAAAAE